MLVKDFKRFAFGISAQVRGAVETVINDARDLTVYRRREGEGPECPKRWARLRKGVVDVPRRAALSQQANRRYLDALAAVDETTAFGDLVAAVCRPVRRWKGRSARGLNPLSGADAVLLAAGNRGEFAITGFRNRELRACLFSAAPGDAVLRRRQSRPSDAPDPVAARPRAAQEDPQDASLSGDRKGSRQYHCPSHGQSGEHPPSPGGSLTKTFATRANSDCLHFGLTRIQAC